MPAKPKQTDAALVKAITALQALRGMPDHQIGEPASDQAIAAARDKFGATFTEEMATLYRSIDGFRLYSKPAADSGFRCHRLDELFTARSRLSEWDYSVGGDPDRLFVFDVGNGSYISVTRLGVPTEVWLDDFREGVQGVVAKNLGALLAKIVRQLESKAGQIFIAKASPIPAGYTAAIARLHEIAETDRRAKWTAEHGASSDDADDWSDV